MKIGLFSDTHYCNCETIGGLRNPTLAYERTREALEIFKKERVDLCFCLGDMTDHIDGDTKEDIKGYFEKMLSLIKSFDIPFYSVPGNHDYLMLTREEIERELGLKAPPYTVENQGISFIILDANYRSDYRCFDEAGVEWTDSNLPPFQVEYLKKQLENATNPVIVLVHQNLDPTVEENHAIKNAAEIRKIIKDSGKVKMVIQGHYHNGKSSLIDGIPYITLSAMCEAKESPYQIIEI
ncbi:MAG: metallophosphoesterase [Clostridia bacterium]|nr:metallophosphoesterase [Clostridia bacterium]